MTENTQITEPVTLTLKSESLALILTALEAGPYKTVKPVIDELHAGIQAWLNGRASSVPTPAPTIEAAP